MKTLNIDTIKNNKGIVANVVAAFAIKGAGMIVSLLSMPLYLNYFKDNMILGVWFTILTVVNWILSFDVGIGNGLRNHLTTALAHKDYAEGKKLTSSGCFVLGIVTVIFSVIVFTAVPLVNWNSMFNVAETVVTRELLATCIGITLVGILVSFFLHIIRGILFALQLASVNNLLHLVTNILLIAFLFLEPSAESVEDKLYTISIAYAIIINIPYVIATLHVFCFTEMKHCLPSFKAVSKKASNAVLGLGISFFFVQIMYMIITVTNEWFISKFFSPEYCVDYQVYFRLFSLISSLLMLAMSPLWSAITKAYAQKRYQWIIKLQRVLYAIAFGCIAIQCLLIPVLQPVINVWLKENAITVNYLTASYFLLYGVVSIWIAIQSTVVAGLGKLKTQLWFYVFAAIFKIVVIVTASHYTNDWSVVVLATGLGLLPYCIVQPIYVNKSLKELELKNQDNE
ncbi:MAG: hypothetical protein MJZ41_12345 [Bacteroidaceae bacterium]|nr:hypothetical protein [Bacteroidaceae bacterium]